MRRLTRLCVLCLLPAFLGVPARAQAPWPPPPEVLARMEALRAVISSPETSEAERRAAREELSRLLRRPGAVVPEPADRKARAAIIPFPSVVAPSAPAPPVPRPPVATIELPSRAPPSVTDPATGRVLIPSGKVAIDPVTGAVLLETPNGYLDPVTGRFVPK